MDGQPQFSGMNHHETFCRGRCCHHFVATEPLRLPGCARQTGFGVLAALGFGHSDHQHIRRIADNAVNNPPVNQPEVLPVRAGSGKRSLRHTSRFDSVSLFHSCRR